MHSFPGLPSDLKIELEKLRARRNLLFEGYLKNPRDIRMAPGNQEN
jgi:hypothetical protein